MRTQPRAAGLCRRSAAAAMLVCLAVCTVTHRCAAAAAVRRPSPRLDAASDVSQLRSGRSLSGSMVASPSSATSPAPVSSSEGRVNVGDILSVKELPADRAVHLIDTYYRVIGSQVLPITADFVRDLGLAAASLYGLFNIATMVAVTPARSAPVMQRQALTSLPPNVVHPTGREPPPLPPPPTATARGTAANRRLLQSGMPSGSPATLSPGGMQPAEQPFMNSTTSRLPIDYAAVVLKVETYATRATYFTRISQQQLFSQHLGLEGSMAAFGYMVEFVPAGTMVPQAGLALLLRLPPSVTQYPQLYLEAVFRCSGQGAVPVTTPAQTVLLAYVVDQIPNLVAVNATGISVAPDGASADVTLLFCIGTTPQQYTATDLRQAVEPSLADSMAAGGVPGNVTLVVIRNGTDPYAQVKQDAAAGCCKTIVTVQLPGYIAPAPNGNHTVGLSGGAIAGIVVGVAAAVLFAFAAALLWRRRQRQRAGQKLVNGADDGNGKLAGPELQDQKLQGWAIPHEQIEICRHEDGSMWLLGEGACGKVFKALRGGVQDVAVKVLVYTDDAALAKFMEEVGILKSLNYDKNIVQFYGACIQPGHPPMLVTEYMEGGDLCSAIERDADGKLKWYAEGYSIALDIARGLFFLHSHGVCHGDLKTRNVLLTRNHTAKVADVGLSQIIDAAGNNASATAWTFAYAAPEVILGRPMGLESDIFSMGVVLHELVSGIMPVSRGNLPEPVVPDECPPDVLELIHTCTATQPEARPTAKQVFAVLQKSCEAHVPRYRLALAAAAAASAAANRSSMGGGSGEGSRLRNSSGSREKQCPKLPAGVLSDAIAADGMGKHSASSINMGLALSPPAPPQLSRSAAPAGAVVVAHCSGSATVPAAVAAAPAQDLRLPQTTAVPLGNSLQSAAAAAPAAAHQLCFGGPGMTPGPSMEYAPEDVAAVLRSAVASAAPDGGGSGLRALSGAGLGPAHGSGSGSTLPGIKAQPGVQAAEQQHSLPSSRNPSYNGASMYSFYE